MTRPVANGEHAAPPVIGVALAESEAIAVPGAVAAELFGLSERHWRRLDGAGLVPAPLRLGAARRWCVEDLRRWALAGCPERQRWANRTGCKDAKKRQAPSRGGSPIEQLP